MCKGVCIYAACVWCAECVCECVTCDHELCVIHACVGCGAAGVWGDVEQPYRDAAAAGRVVVSGDGVVDGSEGAEEGEHGGVGVGPGVGWMMGGV